MSRPERVAAHEALTAGDGYPALVTALEDGVPETVRSLILAGVVCFAERGYHATTTRDVATRAGLSPAGMYVHFPSKAELLARVVSLANELTLEALALSLEGVSAPADRLRAVIGTLASSLAENYALGRVSNYEYRHLPDELRAPIDEQRIAIRRVVHEVIAVGKKDKSFAVPDVNVAARALISLCVDVSRWYSEEEAGDTKKLGKAYADLALRLVSAQSR
jgi:AcrR family transcriptional regulator